MMAGMDLLESHEVRQRESSEEGMLDRGTHCRPCPGGGFKAVGRGTEAREQLLWRSRRIRRREHLWSLAAGDEGAASQDRLEQEYPQQRPEESRHATPGRGLLDDPATHLKGDRDVVHDLRRRPLAGGARLRPSVWWH